MWHGLRSSDCRQAAYSRQRSTASSRRVWGKHLKSERAFYLSDVHVPHEHGESLAWNISLIEKWQPKHLIFGGDLIDANAASRWPNEYEHTLEDEYERGNKVLRDLRMAAPRGCNLVWIFGNHEDNVGRVNRVPKDMRSLVAIKKHVQEYERWKHIPYTRHHTKGAYHVGQVYFIHGHETTEARLDEQAIKMANYEPFSLTVSGHTHRPTLNVKQIMLRKFGLPNWRADAGCQMKFDSAEYMERLDMTQWGHACVLTESVPLKSPRKSREWNAEIKVKELAGDTDVVLWRSNLEGAV